MDDVNEGYAKSMPADIADAEGEGARREARRGHGNPVWGALYVIKIKERAGIVGHGLGGPGGFLEALLKLMDSSDVANPKSGGGRPRLHLIGHSFGCKVLSEAILTWQSRGSLDRPFTSVLLIQPAISRWSFSDNIVTVTDVVYRRTRPTGPPGRYRDISNACQQPVVLTYSEQDIVLTHAYPVGLAPSYEERPPPAKRARRGREDDEDADVGDRINMEITSSFAFSFTAALGAYGPDAIPGSTAVIRILRAMDRYPVFQKPSTAGTEPSSATLTIAPAITRCLGVKGAWSHSGTLRTGGNGWCRPSVAWLAYNVMKGTLFTPSSS